MSSTAWYPQVIFCDALNQMLIFPFVPFLVRDQLNMAGDDPKVPLYAGFLAAAYLVRPDNAVAVAVEHTRARGRGRADTHALVRTRISMRP